MTKYFKFFLIVLAATIISCSEDEATRANQMLIDGSTVKISNSFFSKYTNSTTGKTFYEIYFASEGISLQTFPNYDDFAGSGDLLILSLETNDANSLPAGEYSTFDYAALYKMVNGDWDFISENFDIEGAIKVSKSNNTYTFEFKLSGDPNCSVFHKGQLSEIRVGR